MTITISRTYRFSAAHRIEGHPKCGRLHGHNYRITVEVVGPIGQDGMILDFALLDQVVSPIIDLLDHHYLISQDNLEQKDPYAMAAVSQRPGDGVVLSVQHSTAEELSVWLGKTIDAALPSQMATVVVMVEETDRSRAFWHA